MAMCTRYHIIWWSLSVTCDRSVVFYGNSYSLTNKTDRHDITEISLKVALNTINQTKYSNIMILIFFTNEWYIRLPIKMTLMGTTSKNKNVYKKWILLCVHHWYWGRIVDGVGLAWRCARIQPVSLLLYCLSEICQSGCLGDFAF